MVSELVAPTDREIRLKFSVRHIHQDGARFHTPSWGLCVGRLGKEFGTTWCSEPFCERNAASVLECQRNGIDPAKVIPSVAAKDWFRSRAEPKP
jgi:hypothetical protein